MISESYDPGRLDMHFNELNTQGVRFLLSELNLGLTFSHIALETGTSPERVRRNQSNARRAYDTAQRFLVRVTLNGQEQDEITSKLGLLRERLVTLGETF